MRPSGRAPDEMRAISFEPHFTKHAEGSVLIEFGDTKVICTASVEETVPGFLKGKGQGWVTAEYGMLPRSTGSRMRREAASGKQSGRTQEIQRLIGRSLRAVVDLEKLGERQIQIDCDVIQADGGTRTASITGAFVAMTQAIAKVVEEKALPKFPIVDFLAATSVGIVEETGAILDLNYLEDVEAAVDMNIVMTGAGRFVELQGTGEEATFSRQQLNELLALGEQGIAELIAIQKATLGEIATRIGNEESA